MDYSVCEEWVAVEGEDGGIGVRSEEMPVFHFSQINYNRFLTGPWYPNSHMYLYAASNRTNNLNFCRLEDCCGEYHLTVLPYSGHCGDILPSESRCLAQPILVGDGRDIRPVRLNADLRLLSCRADGKNSVLFRFAETEGKDRRAACLTLPFAPTPIIILTAPP